MTNCTDPLPTLTEPGVMDDFGKELRRQRAVAGITLRSLADRVAFDYSYLAQVERGDRTGSATLAYRCDQALDAHGRLVRLFADRTIQPSTRVDCAPEPDSARPRRPAELAEEEQRRDRGV